jgi:hypothetical protein
MDLSDRPPQSIARLGHGDQMDMIGHQAVRQNLDLDGAAPRKKVEVALIVPVTKECLLAAATTLGDVMGKARCDKYAHANSATVRPPAGAQLQDSG